MPISFADALKKAPKPPPKAESPKGIPAKQHAKQQPAPTWPKIGESQQKHDKQQKRSPPQNFNHQKQKMKAVDRKNNNKRPPQQQQALNKTKKSKKPKPSQGVQLGDVLKLPQPSQILLRPQAAPNLGQDFPSLGAATADLPTTSTWGKSSATSKKQLAATQTKHPSKLAPRKERPSKKQTRPKEPEKATSSLLATFGAKQRSVEEENRLGTFLKDPTTVKKGRQRLGPRKKKFSTLKKKVLQERLEQWRAQNVDLTGSTLSASSTTVALWNYCLPEEAQDDDELEEILSNLREMAAKVGEMKKIHIDKDRGHAMLLFASPQLASDAQACWSGLILGGVRLDAEVLLKLPTESSDTWETVIREYRREEQQDGDRLTEVVLDNILTPDDLEDGECLLESLEDIRQIASDLGSLKDVKVENKRHVVLTYQGAQKAANYFDGRLFGGQVVSARSKNADTTCVVLTNVLTEDDLEDEDCLEESLRDLRKLAGQYGTVKDLKSKKQEGGIVIVEYEGDGAQAAASSMHGQVIGGQTIQAKAIQQPSNQTHIVILQNVLTEDDLEDEDCLEETKEDIAQLASQHGPVTKVEVNVEFRLVKVEYQADFAAVNAALKHFNVMVIGGQNVTASLQTEYQEDVVAMEGLTPAMQETGKVISEGPQPLFSGDKLIPERFAECKRVPKIPNAGTPRKYASLVNDETVKPLLIEMLGELMRLQKRAVEEKNTKVKRRLVMGLREVARGIRSHKVKLVVMANNLDQYGAIDDKLQEIIDSAKEERVPIFYEFNKRGLGKAIGKSIKIAVVGVQSAEGAHQQFKRLLSIANNHGI